MSSISTGIMMSTTLQFITDSIGSAIKMSRDLAKAAIDGEQLGADDETDLLAVSCSSTDYIGHHRQSSYDKSR